MELFAEKSSDVCDENTQLGEHQLQLLQQERQLQKQRQVQQEQQLRLQQHLLRQQITHQVLVMYGDQRGLNRSKEKSRVKR